MGNEMGNNNTSALKDEDNTSEAEKQTLQDTAKEENQITSTTKSKDADTKAEGFTSNNTTELGNETRQEDAQAEVAKGEHQKIPTSEAIYVVEKSAEDFVDATTELGKDAGDAKGKIQTTPTAEAEEVQEKATGLACEDIRRMLDNDSMEGDTHAGDMNVENQMHTAAEVEYVQEKNKVLDSESTSVLEKDSSEGDARGGDVNVENQMHPTAEAKDVHEKATELASDKIILVQNDLLEGEGRADNLNADRLQHPTAEAKNVDGKSARLALNDTRSELQEDKSQEDTHVNGKVGENAVIPVVETKDIQGKANSLAYSYPLNVRDSFCSAVQETTENSSSAGSVEEGGENCEISLSLLEGSKEYDKENESCLKNDVPVSYDHNHLDSKSSIKQEELDSAGKSIDAEFQELFDIHCHHNELVKVQSEPLLQRSESLQRSDFLDNDPHCPLDKDDVLEKEVENQEKKLCADKSDGRERDELGSVIKDTSGIKSDSLSAGNKCNGNLLANANYVANEFLNSPLESDMVDNPLRSDHVEYCVVTNEEGRMNRGGFKMESSHNYNSGQFSEESMKEFKSDMASKYGLTIESNGDFNGETYEVPASNVCGISNNDQVADPIVTENGYQIDVYVNSHNKASDEIITNSEQKNSFVPEAEVDLLITMSRVADCKHDEGEYNKNKIVDEIHKNPEASYAKVNGIEGRETSERCNSHLVTIDQAESLTPHTSASLLHIYNYQQGNVNHSKTSTASTASMLASDLEQAIDKLFGAKVDKLDSSNLTMPAIDLVDDEAFEEEGGDYSQHIEATSSKGAAITSSAATLSIEPYGNNFMLANGGYEALESITRLSTESNPDAPNISAQIQKSPSFNLNLRIEARPEESDQIPLLYQEKTEIGSLSNQTRLDLINSTHHAEHGQCMLQHEEMPVEEKVVTIERSYYTESKTPFLGLSKEEAHLLVTPQKQHDLVTTKKAVKEIESTSPRGKEKRKPRSFFFSSCMCCATAVN